MTNQRSHRRNNQFAGWIAILLFAGIVACIPAFGQAGVNVHESKTGMALPSSTTTWALAWSHTWGGGSSDWAQAATIDNAGNGYIAGATESFGPSSENAFFARYNSAGIKTLNRTWGRATGGSEVWGIAVDGNGNIYITGFNWTGSPETAFLVKFNSTGAQVWNRTWGKTQTSQGQGVTVDGNGNIYITGYTNYPKGSYYDAFVTKYTPLGAVVWNVTWGGTLSDYGQGIGVDASNNVYITGMTKSYGDAAKGDAFIAKFNSTGSQLWNHTWGGANYDYGNGIAVNASGNAWITGYTQSFGAGSNDAFLVSYNSSGTQLWNQTWGYNTAESAIGVAVDGSSNAYITGDTNHNGTNSFDVFLVKYNYASTQLWNVTWGGTGADSGYGVGVDASGSIIVGGQTNSFGAMGEDALILKYVQPPIAPLLAAIASPSTTGNLVLSWSAISSADNYSVYRSTSLITTVASLMPIALGLTVTTYADNGLANGTYYYVVIATNTIGNSPVSNCESVTVAIPGSSGSGIPGPPGVPGYMIPVIMAGVAAGIILVTLKHRKSILVQFLA